MGGDSSPNAERTFIKRMKRGSVSKARTYVWVLTSLDSVVYLYSATREGEHIQELLHGFTGVLVSDFYTVYDSIACPQQKCLIHLLRDLNEELLNHPYDEELKQLVTSFAQLLRPMIDTVDSYGLKRRFLQKHCLCVERFYRQLSKTETGSEATSKCRQRIEKNRNKLFTFLNYDGVPWNNNNAEHADQSVRETAANNRRTFDAEGDGGVFDAA